MSKKKINNYICRRYNTKYECNNDWRGRMDVFFSFFVRAFFVPFGVQVPQAACGLE